MSPASRALAYARLARLDKPAGFMLLLWPTMWSLWRAGAGAPGWDAVLLFVAGVFLARSAGCCLNDIADRRIDAQVARTKMRPLAAGEISVAEAWYVAALLLAGCLALWLLLSPPARLWALAALAIACAYPFAKRFVKVPQLALGVAFGMGIPVAQAHLLPAVPASAWMLFAANFFWVLAYDTIYAMADHDDDVRAGVNSSAVWLGDKAVHAVALCYFMAMATLTLYGTAIGASLAYYFACALGFANCYRFVAMIRGRSRASCMAAFAENHWLGALMMLGLVSVHARW